MSIRQRKDTGRWQGRYTGLDGKIRNKDFDLKSHASEYERDQIRHLAAGTWLAPDAGKTTIAELHADWTQTKQSRKDSTVRCGQLISLAKVTKSQALLRGDRHIGCSQ